MVRRSVVLRVLVAVAALLPTGVAVADAIVVSQAAAATTIAEVFVESDHVRVELEIGVGDLAAFPNVLPDPIYRRLELGDAPLKERLPVFLTRDWGLVADDAPLKGRVTNLEVRPRVKRDAITGEPVPVPGGEEEMVLFVTLEYPLERKPSTLSVRPPLHGDTRRATASVGFVVYHLGVPVTDFRYLPPNEVLDLDWDDPWFSRYRHRNLRRRYDAPLSVFLYVDSFEVRKEIIVRPKDLQHWVDLGVKGLDVIPVEAQGPLKQKAAAFLQAHGTVTVDGEEVEPVLDRVHFVRRTLRTTGVVDPPEPLSVLSATLGVIFAHPVQGLPQTVEVDWDLWSPRIQSIPASATDEAGGLPSMLTPEDRVLAWQNFLKHPTVPTFATIDAPRAPRGIPLAVALGLLVALVAVVQSIARRKLPSRGSVGAVGALVLFGLLVPAAPLPIPWAASETLDAEEAHPVVEGLLGNVYRSFDVRGEGAIYDALSRSVTGELLTDTYLQTRASLELANQGGARVRVQGVELQGVETSPVEEGTGFRARCRWHVEGSVGHWGHIHRRQNRYEALLEVRPVKGAWRIADLEVLSEERL